MAVEYKVRPDLNAIRKVPGLRCRAAICPRRTAPSAAAIAALRGHLLIQMYSLPLSVPSDSSRACVFAWFYFLFDEQSSYLQGMGDTTSFTSDTIPYRYKDRSFLIGNFFFQV